MHGTRGFGPQLVEFLSLNRFINQPKKEIDRLKTTRFNCFLDCIEDQKKYKTKIVLNTQIKYLSLSVRTSLHDKGLSSDEYCNVLGTFCFKKLSRSSNLKFYFFTTY